jgi:hypothetical protein
MGCDRGLAEDSDCCACGVAAWAYCLMPNRVRLTAVLSALGGGGIGMVSPELPELQGTALADL